MPKPLKTVVFAVIGAALVVGAVIAFGPGWGEVPSPAALMAAGLAFVLGDLVLLHLRVGRERYSFTWSELALVVGLVILPGPWLVAVAAGSVSLAHLLARRRLIKVAYNAASAAVGAQLAQVVALTLASPGDLSRPASLRSWFALTGASAVFYLWNLTAISLVVSASQGMSLPTVIRRSLAMSLVVFAGNTGLGVCLVAVGASGPANLLVLPPFVALLFWTYRGYLRAIEERDTWQLMQSLSGQLVSVSEDDVIRVARVEGPKLLGARAIEVAVNEGSEPALAASSPKFRPEHDSTPTLVAPLMARGVCFGALWATYPPNRRLRSRDHDLFNTFANHISSALMSARLFEQTQAEREKLSTVVHGSSDGIAAVDANGAVTAWNPAMEVFTGRPAEVAFGRPLSLGPTARTETGDEISVAWLLSRLEASGRFEVSISVDVGVERRWLSLAASPVDGGNGGAAAVLVARDITARREADDAKQAFVATVSHELRTPLTPLKGFLLTLTRPGLALDQSQIDAIHGRMLSQAERLERLIEDLLSVSQIEKGLFPVAAVPLDLNELVEGVVSSFAGDTRLESPQRRLCVLADPVRLEQVLTNLLGNAAKYSGGHAPVTIVVEHDDRAATISVVDQGPGIPADQHELIFERFRRLGNHMTQTAGGAGLGLFIARHLVTEMGGRIWVESEPGRGAAFRFTLPSLGSVESTQDVSARSSLSVA